MTTQEKEARGKYYISYFNIINYFFKKDNILEVEWVDDYERQHDKGIDIVLKSYDRKTVINLDVKTGIGPDYTKGPAIEVFQKTKASNYEFVRSYLNKDTDYYLYINESTNLNLLEFYLIPYAFVVAANNEKFKDFTDMRLNTSFNGSGKYWQPKPNLLEMMKHRFGYVSFDLSKYKKSA